MYPLHSKKYPRPSKHYPRLSTLDKRRSSEISLVCVYNLIGCGVFLKGEIPGGGGGYSIYLCVGRSGTAPHTLTLFKTNIADFPTLFKTEFRLFNTLFKTFNPNINEQALVKILLFIVQEKASCLRQKLINRHPD